MLLNSKECRSWWLLTLVSITLIVFVGDQESGVATAYTDSSSAQAAGDWQRYAIKGGEFSVQLPTVPAMATYELQKDPISESRSKTRVRHVIGAYSQGVVYAIYVAERRLSLEEFIAQSHYSPSSEFKRDLKVGRIRGKEYVAQNADLKRVTQYFIADRYIYTFLACGSYLGNPDVDIPRFLKSIKFEPAVSLTIVDGQGEQPLNNATVAPDGSEARIFPGKEVNLKPVVITKPEPIYTEDARKNQLTGTVVMRCVFTSSGMVTNIRVVAGLPYGLSEKALLAARQIRYVPAIKDGHFASMYMQLEYNFNLY